MSGLGAARPFPPRRMKNRDQYSTCHTNLAAYGKELVNALGRRKAWPDACRIASRSRSWTRLLLRDADQVQCLCLGRRIGRDLACQGIDFTEVLVLYRPSTDRLRRNVKVASGMLHRPAGCNQRADLLAEFRPELRWTMRRPLRLIRGLCLWMGGARHGQIVRALTERTGAFSPMSGPTAARSARNLSFIELCRLARARARR
jgi:hypothetical protein